MEENSYLSVVQDNLHKRYNENDFIIKSNKEMLIKLLKYLIEKQENIPIFKKNEKLLIEAKEARRKLDGDESTPGSLVEMFPVNDNFW